MDKRGRVRVALTCPAAAGAAACRGTLAISSAGKVRVGKKRRVLAFGRATFTIPRGTTVKVVVKLSRANAALVRRLHGVRVALVTAQARRVVRLLGR
jgi:hypothetical protein